MALAAAFLVAAAAFFTVVAAAFLPGTCSTDAAISSTAPDAVAAAVATGPGEPAAAAGSASSWAASFSENCPSSLLPTSVITPRPNWAGRPVMVRSVTTSTRVPEPSGTRTAVTTDAAVPLPRWSLPRDSITARWAASSFSVIAPLPW